MIVVIDWAKEKDEQVGTGWQEVEAGSMRGIQFILSFIQLSIVFKTIRPILRWKHRGSLPVSPNLEVVNHKYIV